MRRPRTKAHAAWPALLALFVLGGAALALAGHRAGLGTLVLAAGYLAGWAAAYLLTGPRRHRGRVAVALGVGVLAPHLVSVFALAGGVGWLVHAPGFGSIGGAFFFGATLGVIQAVLGRLSGRGFRAGD